MIIISYLTNTIMRPTIVYTIMYLIKAVTFHVMAYFDKYYISTLKCGRVMSEYQIK